ncbi:MAG: monofunctional biosynthetic peptidoglycan transglycosylase [Rhodoferax sp.]|nr:monofunctional biosynthetic peptidoglycan transglycosylase [Rhodoferax sp.]MCL4737192.1 monofunctional biosynthetic peptidoglycan transglycosylase [Burkholderiaceae bacterium]MCP5290455.1 monofunctional biosynthetic peptidoglycan transglycosylase [Burkholderiaceae bacterium]
MRRAWRALGRPLALLLLGALAVQLSLALRIALMAWVDPASTTFQRSAAWELVRTGELGGWRRQWRPYEAIAVALKRAVVASEDSGFVEHRGIDLEALESAWRVNQRRAARQRPDAAPRLRGGSTITQQLAKNLLLSGERTLLRKAQEALLALWLEALLDKRRILEIYLNHVEWGRGVYGAQAAARQHFGIDAARLGEQAAARLAVMLPAPRRFERHPASPYLLDRAATVRARMAAVRIP